MNFGLVSNRVIVLLGMRFRFGISSSLDRSRSGLYIGSLKAGWAMTGTIVSLGGRYLNVSGMKIELSARWRIVDFGFRAFTNVLLIASTSIFGRGPGAG